MICESPDKANMGKITTYVELLLDYIYDGCGRGEGVMGGAGVWGEGWEGRGGGRCVDLNSLDCKTG